MSVPSLSTSRLPDPGRATRSPETPGRSARHPAVRGSGARPAAPIRLTVRGRVVVLGLLLALAGLVVVLAAPASEAANPAGAAPVAVVLPGDTLWSVAQRHVPGSDPFGAIEEIRRLNGLRDYTIHPGQRLVLPRR
ncbi:MAG TPA: LysM peptidoglycan-binding domain-containing protein [Micromonosporaceae bacterium]|nr:LysM peptidoglycan-binding domain-containing protein [Micromonosporaceae bacterium]